MKGWEVGKWIAPSDSARQAGRQPVQVPLAYLRVVGLVALAGFGFALFVLLLLFLGIRPR
jgi:hypothetical protein